MLPFSLAAKYCMSSSGLQVFVGYTLVDITATGVIRGNDPDNIERNQQRNWETILQCIGLRTQPMHITPPQQIECENMNLFNFGELYDNQPQKVWAWMWTIESDGAYDLPNEPLGGLLKDLEQVPIITGLTETAKFMLPILYPHGTIKNVYIERQQSV